MTAPPPPPKEAVPPSKRKLRRLLSDWRKIQVGVDVIVHREAGEPLLTSTRCRPYLLADGTPAILVRGMSDHVPLWRVQLAPMEFKP